MDELRQKLQSFFIGQELTNVECYNVNDGFQVVEQDQAWIVDGGIQLSFTDSSFCFAFDDNMQGSNYSCIDSVQKLLGDLNHYPIPVTESNEVLRLIGQKVLDVKLHFAFYYGYSMENMEYETEKTYMPNEVILTFDGGGTMQLACVDYSYPTNGIHGTNFHYSIDSELLLAVNVQASIADAPLEE